MVVVDVDVDNDDEMIGDDNSNVVVSNSGQSITDDVWMGLIGIVWPRYVMGNSDGWLFGRYNRDDGDNAVNNDNI